MDAEEDIISSSVGRQERPEYGAAVRQLLADCGHNGRPMSFSAAERKTGISEPMLREAAKGIVRTKAMVRRIADGFRVRRVPLLAAAGFSPPDRIDEISDRQSFPGDVAGSNPLGWQQSSPREFVETLGKLGVLVALDQFNVANQTLPCDMPRWREGERLDDMIRLVETGIVAVFAKGSSMEPYYSDGDLVFIRPLDEPPQPEGRYVVVIDGEVTCKILGSINGQGDEAIVTFRPANSVFPAITCRSRQVRFQGVPIGRIPYKELNRTLRALDLRGDDH